MCVVTHTCLSTAPTRSSDHSPCSESPEMSSGGTFLEKVRHSRSFVTGVELMLSSLVSL